MVRTLSMVFALLLASVAVAPAARADGDPTLHEVYAAAQGGHIAQAQQMMQQVLRDHPASAKAHYVAAEIDARAGDLPTARQELATAERLEPTLPFARPAAVQSLRRELAAGERLALAPVAARSSAIPWGLILIIGLGGVLAWAIFSRRRAEPAATYLPAAAPAGMPPGYGPPGYGAGYGGPVMGPTAGGGSGILGNVASGLAVGAGVVAGEELMRHVLERDRPELPAQRLEGNVEAAPNADMGGADFGVNDAGSWDDAGGLGGGGGDDWS